MNSRAEGERAGAPVIILVEPQLPENIGMVARAMANFGLAELRLVAPREGWPQEGARAAAAGAHDILDRAVVAPTLREAVGDLRHVLATTARARGQMKRVLGPEQALAELSPRVAAGERAGIVFGRERIGLENDEVALADAVITFPVDPAAPSLNLAQAVLLIGYEWSRAARAPLPFEADPAASPARRESLVSFLDHVEGELDRAGFFPPTKRAVMVRNLRDILLRMRPGEQDVRTLRGALRALVRGRQRRRSTTNFSHD